MPKKFLSPEGARTWLTARYRNQHQNWLAGLGSWPLQLTLGVPTERDVAEDPASVRAWVDAWLKHTGAGQVTWDERQFPRLGAQRLPVTLVLPGPADVAATVGQAKRWRTAADRHAQMVARWPILAQGSV